MRYFRVLQDGKDVNVVLACEDEDKVRMAHEKYGRQGYELVECDAPKDAHIVSEEPMLPGAGAIMQEYRNIAAMFEPFMGRPRRAFYDTPTCRRCKNRYKHSDFCDSHCHQSGCYRFKLEN